MIYVPAVRMANDPVHCAPKQGSHSYLQPTAYDCAVFFCTPGNSSKDPGMGSGGTEIKAGPESCGYVLDNLAVPDYQVGEFYCDDGYYSASVSMCNAQPLVMPTPKNMVTPALQSAGGKFAGYVILGFALVVFLAVMAAGLSVLVRWIRRGVGGAEPEPEAIGIDDIEAVGVEFIDREGSLGGEGGGSYDGEAWAQGGGVDDETNGTGYALGADEIAEHFPEAYQDVEEEVESEVTDGD